jgi:hypothetical protein
MKKIRSIIKMVLMAMLELVLARKPEDPTEALAL